MKRVTTILMLVAIVVMSSCSRQDDLPQTSGDVVKVTLRAQSPEVQTRAASDIKRYIIEVYEGSNSANIFEGGSTHRLEQTTGSFAMELKKNTEYTFLLWADNSEPNDNASGFYNAGSLKAVAMNEAATTRAEAFCGVLTQIVTSTSSLEVALGHAVAKLVYDNTDKLVNESSKLTVIYPYTATFNVADGTIATTTTSVTRTFEGIGQEVGIIATDYFFAPATEAQLATLSIAINEETARQLTNVPVQANYVTNISGEFSGLTSKDFNISASDEWDGEREYFSFADPATHTVHVGIAGNLSNELIAAAIEGGKELKITGTMGTDDFYTLRDWATAGGTNSEADLLRTLDLSNLTGLTAIPNNAFLRNDNFMSVRSLTTVVLPASVTTIGTNAFNSCFALTSIDLLNVETISKNAFTNCTSLSTINMPKVTHINGDVFAQCRSLTSVDLPSATHIYRTAFSFIENLTAITFGTPILMWQKDAFEYSGTNNIDLTLKKGQRQPVGDGSSGSPNCTGDLVIAGDNATFAEYTFKSITLVD